MNRLNKLLIIPFFILLISCDADNSSDTNKNVIDISDYPNYITSGLHNNKSGHIDVLDSNNRMYVRKNEASGVNLLKLNISDITSFDYDTLFKELTEFKTTFKNLSSIEFSYDQPSKKNENIVFDFSDFDFLDSLIIKFNSEIPIKCRKDTTISKFIKQGSYNGQNYGEYEKIQIEYDCDYTDYEIKIPNNLVGLFLNLGDNAYSTFNITSDSNPHNLKYLEVTNSPIDHFCGFKSFDTDDSDPELKVRLEFNEREYRKSILNNFSFRSNINFNNIHFDNIEEISFNPLTVKLSNIETRNKLKMDFTSLIDDNSFYGSKIEPGIINTGILQNFSFNNLIKYIITVPSNDGNLNVYETKKLQPIENFDISNFIRTYESISRVRIGTRSVERPAGSTNVSYVVDFKAREGLTLNTDILLTSKLKVYSNSSAFLFPITEGERVLFLYENQDNEESNLINWLKNNYKGNIGYLSERDILLSFALETSFRKSKNNNDSENQPDHYDSFLSLTDSEIVDIFWGVLIKLQNKFIEQSIKVNLKEQGQQESSACQCMRAFSGERGYESMIGKCRKMYICFENAKIDCMLGTSSVWTKCEY